MHTFLFADLAGFTALTEAMGDEEAADIAHDFCETTRALLGEYDAEEIKTIGDAIMIRGGAAPHAVRLGLRVVHDVGGRHGFPIVRVGMHTGAAVERNGDWFGAAVNVAARVAGIASGGDVVLTATTRDAAGQLDGVEFRERGRHELRNVSEPLLLFAAVPQGTPAVEGLPVDPVCRMAVDPRHAAGALRHDGIEYHFCSLDCVGKFAAAPERFASSAAEHEGR